MTDYINLWLDIIENMNNENTYKLAWGRALIEIIYESKDENHDLVIPFVQIAEKMLKYYWNQTYFFNLKQSPNSNKRPIIVQETEKCIEFVKDLRHSNIPVWFDRAQQDLMSNSAFYAERISQIAKTLRVDVCWRFKNTKKDGKTVENEIYKLDRSNMHVMFTRKQVKEIKEYAFILSQLLNYKWAQLLEKFNSAPKIALKVKGISDAKIRRNNLSKFKHILLTQMEDGNIIDFYTGKVLEANDISIDHVIPWSFMYSDDIWNLVITSKSVNSSKSNSVPSEEVIRRLEERNKELVEIVKNPKYHEELQVAIDNNYVQKFYVALRL
ncbi:HNH endonuclease domain-containing protein [uncultured Dubosiella sp.]|uniref:HNH endonuclease domain-containing protein n=2 Tax=uncultured Dubosiella sp. TaxID=1937011 RepID=UPI0025B2C987|nr:HNH endonuclease domain-containing protein [uncultured Dubosiella sp.]